MHCSAVHCTAVHCTAVHYTSLPHTTLYCTALHYTVPYYTVLYCTALQFTALHCNAHTTLHRTVLQHNKLDCTALIGLCVQLLTGGIKHSLPCLSSLHMAARIKRELWGKCEDLVSDQADMWVNRGRIFIQAEI